jgi:UDP-glucuronate 4-epimerase
MKKVLVTGSAGFIGFHLSKTLLSKGFCVLGIDNINDYYDVNLKKARLKLLQENKNFLFSQVDISDDKAIKKFGKKNKFDILVNLAAQAGVQFSIENPHAYIDSNIRGFLNILELSKAQKIEHLIYASSSSVYGMNETIPFSEDHSVDHPISLYAASKKSNELMAHSYAYLFNLPSTGLRFFTVYGPWGRPDMALFKFTEAAVANQAIKINNFGNHARDFTYINDIVNGIIAVIEKPFSSSTSLSNSALTPSLSSAPWRILNIGRGEKVALMDFIKCIEQYFGKEIKKDFLPLQAGDVPETYCDTSKLVNNFGYEPITSIEEGVNYFLDWYVDFYNIDINQK